MRIVVTGGAGFIGSNFLEFVVPRQPQDSFLNLDKLTYAANPRSLLGVQQCANYAFEQVDVADFDALGRVLGSFAPELIVHFAAESHVDRSITGPREFVRTNVEGTFNLLELCRASWLTKSGAPRGLFHHVSTDEVFGSLGPVGRFTEQTPYAPRNPYSASKAASDHLVRAYGNTYGLAYKLTNCSNNYGPRQAPEKFIPLTIQRALQGEPIPVYGAGENVRDWLYVEDHCRAIWQVIHHGKPGETYNVGGDSELDNTSVAKTVCRVVAEETGKASSDLLKLIEYVPDRPGHDFRYAMDSSKLRATCPWQPSVSFDQGIRETVRWYLHNPEWCAAAQTADHASWLSHNYGDRGSTGAKAGSLSSSKGSGT